MKYYETYKDKLEPLKGYLIIPNTYEWGYIKYEYSIIIIPNMNYLNRSFHNDYVSYEIIDYKEDSLLFKINSLEDVKENIVFGKIIDNLTTHRELKISGVLNINNKCSYGKTKRNIPIYKFFPYHSNYPTFYVASKCCSKKDVYANISFKEWTQEQIEPIGMCNNIIGELGDIEADYNYILSIFNIQTKEIKEEIEDKEDKSFSRKDYTNHKTFSIDPKGCLDIDDAISIIEKDKQYIIQVHIADVSYFIQEGSRIDKIAKERISSVYSPHKIIHMLPTQLSINILSLLEHQKRYVMTISFICDKEYNIIEKTITNGIIICDHNYNYEEVNEQLESFQTLKLFIEKNNILNHILPIQDSHFLIDSLMVLSNSFIGELLYKNKRCLPLLRIHKESIKHSIDNPELNDFLNIYYSEQAEYCIATNNTIIHSGLNIKYYTHFTSPIRRYWDILVHRQLKNLLHPQNGEKMSIFVDYINKKMKDIKQCHRLLNNRQQLEYNIQNKSYMSYIIDFTDKKLFIYIPELNISVYFRPFHYKLDSILQYEIKKDTCIIYNKKKELVFKKLEALNVNIHIFKYKDIKHQLQISLEQEMYSTLI